MIEHDPTQDTFTTAEPDVPAPSAVFTFMQLLGAGALVYGVFADVPFWLAVIYVALAGFLFFLGDYLNGGSRVELRGGKWGS